MPALPNQNSGVLSWGRAKLPERVSVAVAVAAVLATGPDFELDFTSGLWDPRVTHSRAGGALQVHRDGVLDWGPENLFIRSTDLTNGAAWSTYGGGQSVVVETLDGRHAVRLTPTGADGGLYQSTSLVAGQSYTFSWLLDLASWPSTLRVQINHGGASWVDIDAAGTLTNLNALSASKVAIGVGKFRLAITFVALNSGAAQHFVFAGSGGNGSASFVVGTPRLQRGTHSYADDDWRVQTTSAAVYAARLRYDPVTLACLGYLNEPQRTNLEVSANFAGASWNKILGATAVASDVVGALQFYTVVTPPGGYLEPATNVSVTAGVAHTKSVFVLKGGGSVRILCAAAGFAATSEATLDATAGTLSGASTSGAVTGASNVVKDYGVAWRVELTATPTSATTWNLYVSSVTGTIKIAGPQGEAASTASSYIPTAGSAATRSTDIAYVDVATHLPWLSMTNSTFYAEFIARDYRASERVLGTNQSPASLLEIAWTNVIGAFDGAASFGVTVPSALDVNLKAALALSSGSRAIAAGGVTGSAASNTMSAPTRIYIGSEAGTSRIFSGTIKSARVHSHTKPAAEMAQLTA